MSNTHTKNFPQNYKHLDTSHRMLLYCAGWNSHQNCIQHILFLEIYTFYLKKKLYTIFEMQLKTRLLELKFLPTMFFWGAHTSTVSVIQVFITQWYSKEEQACLNCEQFFSNDLISHSVDVRGQDGTISAVSTDCVHPFTSLLVCKNYRIQNKTYAYWCV